MFKHVLRQVLSLRLSGMAFFDDGDDAYSDDFEAEDVYNDDEFEEYYSETEEEVVEDVLIEPEQEQERDDTRRHAKVEAQEPAPKPEPTVPTARPAARLGGLIDFFEQKQKENLVIPPRAARVLLERIRSNASTTTRPRDENSTKAQLLAKTSLTYSALLPNVESWSVERKSDRAKRRGRGQWPLGAQDSIRSVPAHMVDRLKIESLTLAMQRYDAEQHARYKPVPNVGAGLRRMLEITKRKSRHKISEEHVRNLYDPEYLIAQLAQAQREVRSRFD